MENLDLSNKPADESVNPLATSSIPQFQLQNLTRFFIERVYNNLNSNLDTYHGILDSDSTCETKSFFEILNKRLSPENLIALEDRINILDEVLDYANKNSNIVEPKLTLQKDGFCISFNLQDRGETTRFKYYEDYSQKPSSENETWKNVSYFIRNNEGLDPAIHVINRAINDESNLEQKINYFANLKDLLREELRAGSIKLDGTLVKNLLFGGYSVPSVVDEYEISDGILKPKGIPTRTTTDLVVNEIIKNLDANKLSSLQDITDQLMNLSDKHNSSSKLYEIIIREDKVEIKYKDPKKPFQYKRY